MSNTSAAFGMKRCSKCRVRKKRKEHFWANYYFRDGYDHYCKDCRRAQTRKTYDAWYQLHREEKLVQMRAYSKEWAKRKKAEKEAMKGTTDGPRQGT